MGFDEAKYGRQDRSKEIPSLLLYRGYDVDYQGKCGQINQSESHNHQSSEWRQLNEVGHEREHVAAGQL
jgi:hypothetical protein